MLTLSSLASVANTLNDVWRHAQYLLSIIASGVFIMAKHRLQTP